MLLRGSCGRRRGTRWCCGRSRWRWGRSMRRRRRRRRGMRWRRRRCRMRSLRRRCSRMRSLRRRRSRWLRRLSRSALRRWLTTLRRRSLFLFVLLGFTLLLRHHHWCALRMRGRACKLHRSESGRGKQHEAKFCHDVVDPERKEGSRSSNQRTAIRPDCGSVQRLIRIYFVRHKARKRHCSWRIHAVVQSGAVDLH